MASVPCSKCGKLAEPFSIICEECKKVIERRCRDCVADAPTFETCEDHE